MEFELPMFLIRRWQVLIKKIRFTEYIINFKMRKIQNYNSLQTTLECFWQTCIFQFLHVVRVLLSILGSHK